MKLLAASCRATGCRLRLRDMTHVRQGGRNEK